MIELSIITTLYKSEKYVSKCLDSILSQDIPLSEYEIIVVNDGSPDKSHDIALSYAVKNINIKVVSHENKGLSGARNTGIQLAQGKYLTFIDPDDYIQPNVYKSLLNKMEQDDLDMLRFGYTMVDENYDSVPMPKGAKNTADYKDNIVNGKVFLSRKLSYACFVWTFIYKTSLIKSNNISFKQGLYIDDTDWLPRVLCHANRVTSIDTQVSFYVQREGSLINAQGVSAAQKKIEGLFKTLEIVKEESDRQPDKDVKKWYSGMSALLVLGLLNIISTYFYNEKDTCFSRLREADIFPLSFFRHSKRVRLRILLVNISIGFYCWIMNYRNKHLSTEK